jgi:hypothetical protein
VPQLYRPKAPGILKLDYSQPYTTAMQSLFWFNEQHGAVQDLVTGRMYAVGTGATRGKGAYGVGLKHGLAISSVLAQGGVPTSDGNGNGDYTMMIVCDLISDTEQHVLMSAGNSILFNPDQTTLGANSNASESFEQHGISFTNYDGGPSGVYFSDSTLFDGAPHVLIGRRKQGTMGLYVDGRFRVEATGMSVRKVWSAATDDIGVNQWSDNPDDEYRNFTGTNYVMAIWNRALSEDEISEISSDLNRLVVTPSKRFWAMLKAAGGGFQDGSIALSGDGNISPTGMVWRNASIAIDGNGNLTANGGRRYTTTVALDGNGNLVAAGGRRFATTVALDGNGDLTAAPIRRFNTSVAMSAESTLTAAGALLVNMTATLMGEAELIANGDLRGYIDGSVTLSGESALSALARLYLAGASISALRSTGTAI